MYNIRYAIYRKNAILYFMKHVVLSILGTRKDDPTIENNGWSPSLSLVHHKDKFTVDEYHLIYNSGFKELAEKVQAQIEAASITTKVVLDEIVLKDPWDFDEVSVAFFDYVKRSCFHRANTEYLVHINTGTNVERICLFWLVYSNYIKARLVQTAPSEGFGKTQSKDDKGLLKIIDLDITGNKALTKRINTLSLEGITFLKDGIQTKNKRYNETIDELERLVLASSDPILITGPTGAGKTKLASKIYELKKKHNLVQGEFVSVNCATLDPSTAKSELFGHVKGAFTSADGSRDGFIKTAENGILFLDEIGDLTKDVQTMLLKAIEEHEFHPMGSDKTVKCNFQLICGTNQDLSNPEKFRHDLLQRINRWSYRIPGLAERREDIEPNFEYELEQFRTHAKRGILITEEARKLFMDYALNDKTCWSGNFRELRNMVTRMGTLAHDGEIQIDDVQREIGRAQGMSPSPEIPHTPTQQPETASTTGNGDEEEYLVSLLGNNYAEKYDDIQLATLMHVLDVCKACISAAEAGRHLYNVSRGSRATANDFDRIAKFLKTYNLKFSQLQHA